MNRAPVCDALLPVFCRQLYQLFRAGLPLPEGLDLLRQDEGDPAVRSWLDQLCRDTGGGMPLSAALRGTEAFPAYMTDMIAVAEATGRLEDVLLALARHYDRQLRLRAEVRGAVAAPLALFAVMAAVVVLLVTQVLPVFDRVFAQLGASMGAVATGMLALGRTLVRAGAGIGGVLTALALAAVLVCAVTPWRRGFSAWFCRHFGGRGVLGQMAGARFASALSMAVGSGLGMEESVDLAGRLCGGSRELDEKIARCRAALASGDGAAQALTAGGLFPGRECRLLLLAERTGSLPQALEDLAGRQEEAATEKLDRLVGAIEPTVVVVTGLLAGLILVSVMLPLMSLLNTAA